jgi:hypothetical protein
MILISAGVGFGVTAWPGCSEAQDRASRRGAAETPDGPWPYPSPAQRGATGYTPDYARFTAAAARTDVIAYILWRATDPKLSREQRKYYVGEYADLLAKAGQEQGPEAVRKSVREFSRTIGGPIRRGKLKPPFFDELTGCWFFVVQREGRRDLHAGDCR